MNRRAREFIDDLRANWDNSYWWADRQWLATLILCVILFVYELSLQYFKLRLRARMGAAPSLNLGE